MLVSDISSFLQDAVTEVLETMCFLSVDKQTDDWEGDPETVWLAGELDFVGHPSGRFGIALPSATAGVMAANFLGEDESELDGKQVIEAVGEMTNMVCGSLLSHLDPKAAFSLSPPRNGYADVRIPSGAGRICGIYSFDEGSIYAWLQLQEIL